MTDGAPSPYELYQATRDQIRHENELVNHRLGWFLAVEGFLLAGFLNALALYSTLRPVCGEVWLRPADLPGLIAALTEQLLLNYSAGTRRWRGMPDGPLLNLG